jgi:hypothetical protein
MQSKSLKVKTGTKSGGTINHNQNLSKLKVKTRVKAGQMPGNHNQNLSSKSAKPSLKIKTRVKAGQIPGNHNQNLAHC